MPVPENAVSSRYSLKILAKKNLATPPCVCQSVYVRLFPGAPLLAENPVWPPTPPPQPPPLQQRYDSGRVVSGSRGPIVELGRAPSGG